MPGFGRKGCHIATPFKVPCFYEYRWLLPLSPSHLCQWEEWLRCIEEAEKLMPVSEEPWWLLNLFSVSASFQDWPDLSGLPQCSDEAADQMLNLGWCLDRHWGRLEQAQSTECCCYPPQGLRSSLGCRFKKTHFLPFAADRKICPSRVDQSSTRDLSLSVMVGLLGFSGESLLIRRGIELARVKRRHQQRHPRPTNALPNGTTNAFLRVALGKTGTWKSKCT